MNDCYNVRQYIPKKFWPEIDQIDKEAEFDNRKNRTVYFYCVWFKDGNRVSGIGIADIKQKVKRYFEAK